MYVPHPDTKTTSGNFLSLGWYSHSQAPEHKIGTPQKFNSEFTPEKWWLEDDPPFLLGSGNFSGAMLNFGTAELGLCPFSGC